MEFKNMQSTPPTHQSIRQILQYLTSDDLSGKQGVQIGRFTAKNQKFGFFENGLAADFKFGFFLAAFDLGAALILSSIDNFLVMFGNTEISISVIGET